MKSIVDLLQEVVKLEETKHSKENDFKKLEKTIDEMKKFGYDKKSTYSFPLVDTIGKTYYSILNKKT